MAIGKKFAASQHLKKEQLEKVNQELGSTLCAALEGLTSKLTDMPRIRRNASPREYAELREAKALIGYLKYPDPTEPVRLDELAWALKCVKESYRADAQIVWLALFDRAAEMLGIDLEKAHLIPSDLDGRIGNELRMMARSKELHLAEAV